MNISFVRPLPNTYPRVTQWFGENPEAYKRFGIPFHNGLDYSCPMGTPIFAAHGGHAITSYDKDFGNYIKIFDANNQYYTIYAHLNTFLVSNQLVEQGQIIATSGNTGNSTGPHLHWGVKFLNASDRSGLGGWSNPVPFRDAKAQRSVEDEGCEG